MPGCLLPSGFVYVSHSRSDGARNDVIKYTTVGKYLACLGFNFLKPKN